LVKPGCKCFVAAPTFPPAFPPAALKIERDCLAKEYRRRDAGRVRGLDVEIGARTTECSGVDIADFRRRQIVDFLGRGLRAPSKYLLRRSQQHP